MINEIKVGDTVRVSKAVPNMYIVGIGYGVIEADSKVKELDEGNALIKWKDNFMVIPLKYLVKVGGEEKEPRFKVGDTVRIKDGYYKEELHGCIGVIIKIDRCHIYVEIDSTIYPATVHSIEPYTEPTEKKKDNTITIPVKAEIDDSFWDAYTADLAKEIAVKITNKHMDNNPNEVGGYAVAVAKSVVEELKKK